MLGEAEAGMDGGEHQRGEALGRAEGSLGLFGCRVCTTPSPFNVSLPLGLPFLFSTPSLYIIPFLRAFPHLDSPLTPMPANYWASLCDYLLHAAEGESRLRSGGEVRERASSHEKWLHSVPHCSETFGKAACG